MNNYTTHMGIKMTKDKKRLCKAVFRAWFAAYGPDITDDIWYIAWFNDACDLRHNRSGLFTLHFYDPESLTNTVNKLVNKIGITYTKANRDPKTGQCDFVFSVTKEELFRLFKLYGLN